MKCLPCAKVFELHSILHISNKVIKYYILIYVLGFKYGTAILLMSPAEEQVEGNLKKIIHFVIDA